MWRKGGSPRNPTGIVVVFRLDATDQRLVRHGMRGNGHAKTRFLPGLSIVNGLVPSSYLSLLVNCLGQI
jgi:hypothetical protein